MPTAIALVRFRHCWRSFVPALHYDFSAAARSAHRAPPDWRATRSSAIHVLLLEARPSDDHPLVVDASLGDYPFINCCARPQQGRLREPARGPLMAPSVTASAH